MVVIDWNDLICYNRRTTDIDVDPTKRIMSFTMSEICGRMAVTVVQTVDGKAIPMCKECAIDYLETFGNQIEDLSYHRYSLSLPHSKT